MIQEIIKHEILLEYEPEFIAMENCTFLKDFGPWKKYNFAIIIEVHYEEEIMVERNKEGHVIKSCFIGLAVVEKEGRIAIPRGVDHI